MGSISEKYQELKPEEVEDTARLLSRAWMNDEIPLRQYELCVLPELAAWLSGETVVPYSALVRCVEQLPSHLIATGSLLEVGASCGYNREVLRVAGFLGSYRALDFSPAYKALAEKLWPDIEFDVGDARALPYSHGNFDIVLSGSVLLHVREYESVIAETARVCGGFAIFHRTPVWDKNTTYYVKEAYGVPCLEIVFNQAELFEIMEKYGLQVVAAVNVGDSGLRSFVCKKGLFHHSV